MKAEVLVEVKKEVEKMKQDLSGLAGIPSGFQVLYLCRRRTADGEFVWTSETSTGLLQRMNIRCLL
jgi:hypothetical protein